MKKDYSRYWQLSKFYLHEDITLQLDKMKNKKMAIRCNRDFPLHILPFKSLVNILSSLFRVYQQMEIENGLQVYSIRRGKHIDAK